MKNSEISKALYSIGIYDNNEFFDDCFQEASMAAFKAGDKTPAYKRRAAQWAALNFLNRQKRQKAWEKRLIPQPATHIKIEESVIERDNRMERFRKIMGTLTLRERIVFLLVVFSPFNQNQIGCALNITDKKVRKLFRRAQQKMLPLERNLGILIPVNKPRGRSGNAQYKGKQKLI
ncbi:MAG: sigma-70 family RNA polymerase sigma factor [bacterium]